MVIQWLRLSATKAGGTGLIPGWKTKILHAVGCTQKNKNKTKDLEKYTAANLQWLFLRGDQETTYTFLLCGIIYYLDFF